MTNPRSTDPRYWYSAWQFVLSTLAVLCLAAGALSCLVFGIVMAAGVAGEAGEYQRSQATGMFLLAGSLAACLVLLLPSAYYSLRRMMGRATSRFPALPAFLRPTILILAFPLVILLGYWVSSYEKLAWFILPVVHVLAIGLPVLWISWLAVRQLPLGSPQRASGVFGSALVLGPAIIIFLEGLALVVFGVVAVIAIAGQHDLVGQLQPLSQSLLEGQGDPEELLRLIVPWLARPGVILAAVFFASLIVPLIEEAIKPIGVWLLVGFNLSPAAGFAAGALCGAAFALFESLALTSTGQDWAVLVTARIGAALVHILNTALMGWAMAMAWQDNRYVKLGLVYIVVVFIHGFWNALSIVNAFDTLLQAQGLSLESALLGRLSQAVPYILGVTAALGFAYLLWFRSRLARQVVVEAPGAGSITIE